MNQRAGHGCQHATFPVTRSLIRSLVLLPFLVSPTLRAQERPAGPTAPPVASPSESKPKALKTETDLTLINVSVTDPMDRIVTGLEQENFRIFEDGVEQEVVNFSSQDVRLDRRTFRYERQHGRQIQKSRLAAGQFFRTSNPQDEFFLVDFNDRAQLISPFTASVDDLQNRLMFTNAHGLTCLARRNLPGPEPNERSTQHQESFAHHIRWRR